MLALEAERLATGLAMGTTSEKRLGLPSQHALMRQGLLIDQRAAPQLFCTFIWYLGRPDASLDV
jgi:hypothetical protein